MAIRKKPGKKSVIKKKNIGLWHSEVITTRGNVYTASFVRPIGWCVYRNGSMVKKGIKRRMKANRLMIQVANRQG